MSDYVTSTHAKASMVHGAVFQKMKQKAENPKINIRFETRPESDGIIGSTHEFNVKYEREDDGSFTVPVVVGPFPYGESFGDFLRRLGVAPAEVGPSDSNQGVDGQDRPSSGESQVDLQRTINGLERWKDDMAPSGTVQHKLLTDAIVGLKRLYVNSTYRFPNHPVIPTKPAVFDDSELLPKRRRMFRDPTL